VLAVTIRSKTVLLLLLLLLLLVVGEAALWRVLAWVAIGFEIVVTTGLGCGLGAH